jgi:hypothetical protein
MHLNAHPACRCCETVGFSDFIKIEFISLAFPACIEAGRLQTPQYFGGCFPNEHELAAFNLN